MARSARSASTRAASRFLDARRDDASRFGRKAISSQPTDKVAENIDAILDFYHREEARIGRSQRTLQRAGRVLGRPAFLASILACVAAWIAAQVFGLADFDPPPFGWLQGILALSSLLMATVILITQNRQTHVEAMHAQLDLQVNLLTEHKVSKLIELVEELRRDIPMVKVRRDRTAEAMQEPVDAQEMLQVLDDKRVGEQLMDGGAPAVHEDRGGAKAG